MVDETGQFFKFVSNKAKQSNYKKLQLFEMQSSLHVVAFKSLKFNRLST